MFVLALVVPPYVFGRVTRRLALQKELLEERQELVTREAVRPSATGSRARCTT